MTVLSAVAVSIPQAYAYRAARVTTDGAEMKASPSPDANTITTLPRGARVNTSDHPTGGYYRARSAAASGWIQDSDLDFGGGTGQLVPAPAKQAKERMEDQNREPENTSHAWAVKAFGGLDLWKTPDLDTQIQSNSLDTGSGYGAEIDYGFSKDWFFAFRVESMSKKSTGPFNGDTLNFELSSMPVMVGFQYQAAPGDNFSLDLGGYVGGGFSTQVTQTDTSLSANNITKFSGMGPTFLLAADLNWHITTPFWLFGELGYRYLKTAALPPNPIGTGNAGALFKDASGNPVSIPLDLSGVVINFGARINF